jgi:phosphatidylglycerophosphate synthase
MKPMTETPARRPLASRNAAWARALAGRLAAAGVAPNRISQASMVCAAAAAAAFAALAVLQTPGPRIALLLLGAAGCQLRLLCNLLDGMVAVEAGRGEPDGPFWNEAPDRVSDVSILVGVGLGAGWPALGWAAACLAVLTAYVRELGAGRGLPADFRGPMAKPHRMAAVTLAAVVCAAAEATGHPSGPLLAAALGAVALGAGLTAWRRARAQVALLRRGPGDV